MNNLSANLVSPLRDLESCSNHKKVSAVRALTLAADINQQRLWNEFVDGMSCLTKYMHQSRLNYSDIVRSNTLLLHANLKRIRDYQQKLKFFSEDFKKEKPAYYTQPLIAGDKIDAALIRLGPTDNALNSPTKLNTGISERSCLVTQITLIIQGSLFIRSESMGPLGLLKVNEVLIQEGTMHHTNLQLSTQKPSVLLNIYLKLPRQ